MPNPVLDAILAELDGARTVIDTGCGRGTLARALGKRGFDVTGIDPQMEMIELARAGAPGARFDVASAARLPYPDQSFDAAVFLNSLHHIPVAEMEGALREAVRVTRRGGRIVVVEPLAEGPLFEVLRPVDDETEVRAKAQAVMDRTSFPRLTDVRFERVTTYADEAAFTASLIAGDPGRAEAMAAQADTLRGLLARHARHGPEGFALSQPMRLRSFAA